MKVNANNARGWTAYDPETVANTDGGVSHGASAAQNLRAMGEDVIHAIVPIDRAIIYGAKAAKVPLFGPLLAPFGVLIGLAVDALEIVALPLMLLKNLIDAIVHAFAALGNAVQGERDGEAVDVKGFDYETESSIIAQFKNREPHFATSLPPPKTKTGVNVR